MKILAITQARTGSSRLPDKVLKTVNGQTLLALHLERILKSSRISGLLVATTTDPRDELIETEAARAGVPVYRGSVTNVLDRFYQAARPYQPEWVVRLTSDCPLIDPVLLDRIIDTALEKGVDYCSNTLQPSFPDGMDAEVFRFAALEKAWREAELDSDKEHVTPYIHRNSDQRGNSLFRACNFANIADYSQVRLTVDEEADFRVIRLLIEKGGTDKDWKTYADLYRSDPDIQQLNAHIKRNEGYFKSIQDDHKI